MNRRLRALPALIAVLALAVNPQTSRAEEARCTSGRWAIDGGPLAVGPLTIDTVGLRDGQPVVDARCRAVRWGLVQVAEETRLRALFVCLAENADDSRRFGLRLRARIVDGCEHMQGAFAIRRLATVVRFTATLAAPDCASNADCRDGAYCATEPGHCAARGVCTPRPTGCPAVVEPVCGCDRVTYPNACEAAAAGMNVAQRGECRTVCGGITGVPCDDGEYCDLPPGECDAADLQGRCVEVAEACPEIYAPVCGCDGITYDNDCVRIAARAQKAHDGPCTCVPKTAPCATACDCYAALGTAFCDDCPLLCPSCGDYWQCKEGACVEQCGIFPPELRECLEQRCVSNVDCADEQFCARPFGVCDAGGVCDTRPMACPDVYLPVCGCDGKTYGNRCEAAAAGANVAGEGECKDTCPQLDGVPCDPTR